MQINPCANQRCKGIATVTLYNISYLNFMFKLLQFEYNLYKTTLHTYIYIYIFASFKAYLNRSNIESYPLYS